MATVKSPLSLGIDIGGTFTDLVVYDETKNVYCSYKELTTPEDPTQGVVTGLRHLFARERLDYADVGKVVHATTLFTNALIERKGARTGLITTQGFSDVLEIGREAKYEVYDIYIQLPRPLVPAKHRVEVAERTRPDGKIEIPLDEQALIARAQTLVDDGVRSIAIVFLHAYANPHHEQRARDLLQERFPNISLSISSEVAPQIREYERTSTTVANAYIKPLANVYLGRLGDTLRALGMPSDLFLMLSNGGFTNIDEAKRTPIQMLESGPAAGALAGAYFGERSSCSNVLAFDMGGTTAKLAVVDDGEPLVEYSFEASRERRFLEGSGLPINISTVKLIEIGAGGGSIAHIDDLGLLKVGPQSAGSVPGPACYQRGGKQPTVTDANLMLGYLDPAFFAGGTMRIDVGAARTAIGGLASAAAMDAAQTAWGVFDLVNETMASAARVHVSEQGRDPRRYALLTTGGGGPLHGCEVARKLGISRIVCPASAGVASALGLLMAPTRIDRVATLNRVLEETEAAQIEAVFAALEHEAREVIAATGIDPAGTTSTRLADMRYAGQGYELVVELPAGPYGHGINAALRDRFEAHYRTIYRDIRNVGPVEMINLRACVQAPAGAVGLQARPPRGGSFAEARKGTRQAYFGTRGYVEAAVYDRKRLGIGSSVSGPALIEEPESTLLLPPGSEARVEENGNIVVTLH
jgi:N-methylhydantoinase A